MNQEIVELLQGLADKFGTTTEMLWGVLLKQAPINGFVRIVGLLFVLGVFGIASFITFKLSKNIMK